MLGFRRELDELKNSAMLRTVRDRASAQGRTIKMEDRTLINFASNDYLGLANHPALIASAIEATQDLGTGAGASRLLSGGTTLTRRLEEAIAKLKGTPRALMMNSGYAANLGAIPALARSGDLILSDAGNHASIIDGCRLSRAETAIYRHSDTAHLAELLTGDIDRHGHSRRRLIVTDSVFSMHGEIAPIPEILGLAREFDAILYIDDAHATGVLAGGAGSLRHFGLAHEPRIIQMGTCSKALGSFGAYIAGDEDVIDWLANSARSFIYSTALPPGPIAATLAALRLIDDDPSLIKRLWDNRALLLNELLRENISRAGTLSSTPIIPVSMDSVAHAMDVSAGLFARGFYAPAIRPPTVQSPIIRITVTAAHTPDDLRSLARAMADIG